MTAAPQRVCGVLALGACLSRDLRRLHCVHARYTISSLSNLASSWQHMKGAEATLPFIQNSLKASAAPVRRQRAGRGWD